MGDFVGIVLAVAIGAWLLMVAVMALLYLAAIVAVVGATGFALYWIGKVIYLAVRRVLAPKYVGWSLARTERRITAEINEAEALMRFTASTRTSIFPADERGLSIFELDDEFPA